MARRVERLEGLALLGSSSLGTLSLDVPLLLEPAVGGVPTPSGLSVRQEAGPVGTRHLVLGDARGSVDLRFPVLAPEVAATERRVHSVGANACLVHAPLEGPDLVALRSARWELVVLGNARALWEEGEALVRTLGEIRSIVGAGPLLWAPRLALPHRIPFLVYVGVDLLDSIEGRLASAGGAYLDLTLGTLDAESALREDACDCTACTSLPEGPRASHAEHLYRRAIAETRAALWAGRLRELVEARVAAEPALAEMLRYTDRLLARTLEERAPVRDSGVRNYVLAESHRRPEMVRFRSRLLERYRPPPSKSVLLLVPCSKTKPYRRSRSHRRFAAALDGIPGLAPVHVVSVSSPIGLVPRELEDVYPARHYDIPVTGEWSEPERSAVTTALRHLLATGRYRSVVAHLDPEEYRFITEATAAGPTVHWTISDRRTTTAEALGRLRAAMGSALDGTGPVEGGPLAVVREELHELASVQFGRESADRLFAPPVRLAGRPWFQRLTDGKVDLATVREERGLFFLTAAGAQKIGTPCSLAVDFDPALPLAGDLFVPGVRSADAGIRVGDSVVLLRNGQLAGVGEALLPGPLMTQIGHGVAVRVRHRTHSPTDMPMTPEESPPDTGPVV